MERIRKVSGLCISVQARKPSHIPKSTFTSRKSSRRVHPDQRVHHYRSSVTVIKYFPLYLSALMIMSRVLLLVFLISTTMAMAGQVSPEHPAKTATHHAFQRVKNFGDNPGALRMFMHIPPETFTTTKRPLVVVIHGCMQSAERRIEQSGWNELAAHAGFYVLYVEQSFWMKIVRSASTGINHGILPPGKGEVASVPVWYNTLWGDGLWIPIACSFTACPRVAE